MSHLAAGFVGGLCLALAHRWVPDRIFMLLTAYMDESGTHDGSPVCVVAALMGNVRQWRRFEAKLKEIKAEYEFQVFHSKRFKAQQGEFAGWHADKYLRLPVDLTNAVGHILMEGVTMHVDVGRYAKEYRGNISPRLRLDTAYGLAFRGCLIHLLECLDRRLGHHNKFDQTELSIVLERGHRHSGDAERIFWELKDDLDRDGLPILKTFTTATKEEADPLMAADFLAHTMYMIDLGRRTGKPGPVDTYTGPPHRAGLTHLEFEPGGFAKAKQAIIDQQMACRRRRKGVMIPAASEELG